jgi:hypothetical protein
VRTPQPTCCALWPKGMEERGSFLTRQPSFHCAVLCCAEAVLTSAHGSRSSSSTTASTANARPMQCAEHGEAWGVVERRSSMHAHAPASAVAPAARRNVRRACSARPGARRPPLTLPLDLHDAAWTLQAHACVCGGPARAFRS